MADCKPIPSGAPDCWAATAVTVVAPVSVKGVEKYVGKEFELRRDFTIISKDLVVEYRRLAFLPQSYLHR